MAYERVVRGENLVDQLPDVVADFGLPLELQPWEPDYALVKYGAHKVEHFESLGLFDYLETVKVAQSGDVDFIDDPAIEALAALTREWTSNSNGNAEVVGVNGGLDRGAERLRASYSVAIGTSRRVAHYGVGGFYRRCSWQAQRRRGRTFETVGGVGESCRRC